MLGRFPHGNASPGIGVYLGVGSADQAVAVSVAVSLAARAARRAHVGHLLAFTNFRHEPALVEVHVLFVLFTPRNSLTFLRVRTSIKAVLKATNWARWREKGLDRRIV